MDNYKSYSLPKLGNRTLSVYHKQACYVPLPSQTLSIPTLSIPQK